MKPEPGELSDWRMGDLKGSLTQANRARVGMGRWGMEEARDRSLAQSLSSGLPSSITCRLSGAPLLSQVPLLVPLLPVDSWLLPASFFEEYAFL